MYTGGLSALTEYQILDLIDVFRNNKIESLIDARYKVIYFEAEKDFDLYNAVKSTGKTKKISLFIIGGHGSKTNIAFGTLSSERTKKKDEIFYLDVNDQKKLISQNLENYLKHDSVIILESCSTGKGGSTEKNLANMLKAVFPYSNIFAPMEPTSSEELIFNPFEQVIGVKYSCEECTYKIRK